MSENKRRRIPYCQLSQEEKDRINARRRALYAEKKSQRENRLFPVEIQEQVSAEENIESSLGYGSVAELSYNEEEIPNDRNVMHMTHTGSSAISSSSREHDECMLYDISIGMDTFTTAPTVPQRAIPMEPYKLLSIQDCKHCGARRFPYETPKFCCSGGEVRLYPITIPAELQQLYSGLGADSAHFLQYVKPYNEIFAFTSMGVHLDPVYAKRTNGIYTFRAQGQIYHFIDNLYPSGQMPSYLQLYFYDTQKEIDLRKRDKDKLQSHIISGLINTLGANPYSQFFRSLSGLPNIDECEIILRANPRAEDSTALPPTVSQVAAIWIEDEDATELRERDIIVRKQEDGHSQKISYYYGCYDPLQYPLLFPSGEPGWHEGIKKVKASNTMEFCSGQGKVLPNQSATAEELITTETAVRQENARKGNMVSAREFYAYRLQIRRNTNSILLESARLLQQFTVDMYVKIETSRLDYFRNKQEEIRADLYQGIVDSIGQGESDPSKIGKRIVLPGSFIGGPRDMRKRYLDAMTLVERYGKPDLFLTMTCNPNWQEIKNEMKPHEEAQNRPDLLSRVFKSKLEHLQKEIVKNQLFGPIAAYTFVVEFQKRGLPHVHMLLILKKPFKLNTVAKIDAFISAEIPDKEKYPHLYAMVLKHMMHGPCGELDMTKVCMQKGKCRSNYPRSFCAETTIDADGYPIYRRQATGEQVQIRGHMLDNRWVVPYNPYLLATFDCHINVEVCSTIKAVKYLYKYIYKGHDKIIYRLATSKFPENIDEIQQFQTARWISPPEAVWRIFRFSLHEMRPAVISLQLHLEGCQLISLKKDSNLQNIVDNEFLSRTMLTQFFWMNTHNKTAKALKLLYKDFPQHFVWNSPSKSWTERKQQEVVGRIITANPSEGERYYLRLLLTYIPAPTSYAYLRTNGVTFESYREAAISHGLLEDDKSNEKCMEEACTYRMPFSLRQLFSTILVYCAPLNPLELFFKFEDNMVEDYISVQKISKDVARQTLLQTLNAELESMGKNLNHFQLSQLVTSDSTKKATPREVEDEMNIPISEDDLKSPDLLNHEQLIAYNDILDAVFHKKPKCFFIDGSGGTGKTFLYRALLAAVRLQHQIALATASSGVAASILPNGRTAHSRFKIPVSCEGKPCCSVSKQSGLATLLKETALIIWDEASMAKKESIEALDYLLRDLTDNDTLFGGKVVVLGGDFRQVLPVIPRGTRHDCINASIVKSYIWQSLIKFKLTQNMRARIDPAFSAYILRVGNGLERENEAGEIKLPTSLVLQPTSTIPSLDQLIQFYDKENVVEAKFRELEQEGCNIKSSKQSLAKYQRIILQDKEGNKMQATIFGYNIRILQNTLKMYHTYCITNAAVGQTPEKYRFLENKYQLAINARTPVEEIQIDGLTLRTMRYNFTPITAISQVRVTDPKIEVGPLKVINDSYVVDVRVVDQGMQPTIISLWDQFSDYEARAMAALPGSFPVAIGLRLKTSTYYGLTLATRNTSSFIFNPPIPEATALQSWCVVNANKIRELPTTPTQLLLPNPTEESEATITKIANLPVFIQKVEFLTIKGIARVIDFGQKFYYLACSICNKATNAYGDDNFWCNYCLQKVPALAE
ncbi:hypothetical protein RHGRI_010554 [Rhododendron griersonianum]|uniref:ATP-dependent DNA helicase n=1 Tax=Rhododendron griersonianum TaxID=479676 RepID=A0AAV6KIX5_9ERIC|nr:hypothetical protein RHGRI_010554 [Rhododendron griersonianum]